IELLLQRIPSIGPAMARAAHRLKDSLKHLIIPGMLFEELGFKYYGPIDGHDLPLLISTLRDAKERHDPVLIHVLTRKGKGYPPAEANAAQFHGTGPFKVETGLPEGGEGKPTYTAVFGRTLAELGRQDPRIIGITAAMPEGTGLNFFAEACPERFFDVGIAEQHAVTFAAGLAAVGMRPVVAIYSTFLQRAYDQIIHDVCLQGLPVVFALDRAGLVGEDGPTHHGAFDLSYLRAVPDLVVMAPKDEPELQHMLYTALRLPGPAAIRYPRGQGPGAPLATRYEELPVGKGELLRAGKDVALVAVGSQVYPALEAADLLAQSGIEAAVINARFVKPLDEELLCRVAERCGRVVTVEENALCGGFGSAVLELFQRKGLAHLPTLCLGLPDQFIPHGKRSELLALVGLTGQGIAGSVLSWLGKGEMARVGSGCSA
ncbi:MAG: 1-deoxy-D-xylulose-5-phosphate synthase, partial [Bacillota bacterium]|nr:1-deoxy-D-xylulose-5-phosphate synthase [Bacillota bacterium]